MFTVQGAHLKIMKPDLLASEIREIARPRDPVLAKQVKSVLERVEIYPPECDDLEAIEEALEEYGIN